MKTETASDSQRLLPQGLCVLRAAAVPAPGAEILVPRTWKVLNGGLVHDGSVVSRPEFGVAITSENGHLTGLFVHKVDKMMDTDSVCNSRFIKNLRCPFFIALASEASHFMVGLATLARPASLSIVPRRAAKGWTLGEVKLANARWYNAAPTALAPLALVLLPWWIAVLRTRPGWHFTPLDAGLAFLIAPQFLACWPSAADWKLALRSWPLLLIAGAGWYAWTQYPWRWPAI